MGFNSVFKGLIYHCAHRMAVETCGLKFGFVLYIVTWGLSVFHEQQMRAHECSLIPNLPAWEFFFFFGTLYNDDYCQYS